MADECFILRDHPHPLPSHCPAIARKVHFLVEEIHGCRTVRQCFLLWHFVSLYIGFPLRFYAQSVWMFGFPPEVMKEGLKRLQVVVEAKARSQSWEYLKEWRHVATALQDAQVPHDPASPTHVPRVPSVPSPRHTALLVHYAAGAKAMADAAPFIDLLACFASRQGMSFVYDKTVHFKPTWLRYNQVGVLSDAYILGRGARPFTSDGHRHRSASSSWNWTASNITDAGAVAGRFLLDIFQRVTEATYPGRFKRGIAAGDAERTLLRLSNRAVWRRTLGMLGVVSGPPLRWVKALAIQRALSSHEAVVYLDYDVTVRPDCLGAARLVQDIFSGSIGTGPHIVVRDSPPGADCMNTGFIAVRKSPVSKAFIRLWKSKMGWPGAVHGDQGPLAETVLQLLDIERRMEQVQNGSRLTETYGYESTCLPMLFPTWYGVSSWREYCDCWQQILRLQVGPYQNRHSRFIKFINPQKLDVNFVPQHLYDLPKMRLLPWQLSKQIKQIKQVSRLGNVSKDSSVLLPELTPLIVHWAGFGNRTHLMREYLVRRFGVKPTFFKMDRFQRCSALAAISPRVNRNCIHGSMGSSIEHIYENWDESKLDNMMRDVRKAEATFAAALVAGELPDHTSDHWTVTARFRDDLLSLLGGKTTTRDMTVLELGTYVGYTTSFLAGAFRFAFGVDSQASFVKHATELLMAKGQENRSTVLHLNTLTDDLSELARISKALGGIDVVFIDADHSFASVVNDLGLALYGGLGPNSNGGRPRYIVLDDVFSRAEVRQAFVDFENLGLLRRVNYLGHEEGILCEVAPQPLQSMAA
ncbi:GIP [Symbiodinium natans]|uniref:GIP protein n=1 Tax=Symbiodinium natans TaxID=878477 RepID=A0A812KS81_9DINO|nr:GIP [Symbiodinium natans]